MERPYNSVYLSNLPVTKMVYPEEIINKLKYYIFKLYSPIHPFCRDLLLDIGIIYHTGRQNFLLGKLKEEKTIEEFSTYLTKNGFGNHFVAWKDDGEVISLRLVKDFKYQHHLRIFKDGEIRGHYEYTPEYRPIAHMKEINMKEGRELFDVILDGWIK